MRSLTLKSWEAREVEYLKKYLTGSLGSPPLFVSQMRSQKSNNTLAPLYGEPSMCDMGQPVTNHLNSQDLIVGFNDNPSPSLLPQPQATDSEAMDWNYWNDLMQGPYDV